MTLNNKGFGAIETVLTVVIVGILGFVGYRAYIFYTDSPDTGVNESGYDFRNNEKSQRIQYEVVDIPIVTVRCQAIGPGCNSDPIVLKGPDGNEKDYEFYGDVVNESDEKLQFYKDVEVGDMINIEIDGDYITKIIVII